MKDVAMGFVTGAALSAVGFPFTTWQFWMLFGISLFWRFVVAEIGR